MSVSESFRELLIEHLAPLGPVQFRRMFGGGGVYLDGVMFGLVDDDVLYLKADDGTRAMVEAEGMGPFVYDGKGKPITMSYWRAPERLYDEPDDLIAFARAALGVARKAVAARAKSVVGKGTARNVSSQPSEQANRAGRRRRER